MTKTDGGLRSEFQKHMKDVDWQAIETWSTGAGVPDLNYCISGFEGWIELKQTSGWKVDIRPEQVAWIERRLRFGGRVWIAVRRKTEAGPRRGPAVDDLYILKGIEARPLAKNGLQYIRDCSVACGRYQGGPGHWNWNQIRSLLTDNYL